MHAQPVRRSCEASQTHRQQVEERITINTNFGKMIEPSVTMTHVGVNIV